MKKNFLFAFYNVLALTCVWLIQKISPTNMSGIGFDILVYVGAIIFGIALCAKSIMRVQIGRRDTYVSFFINALGLVLISVTIYYLMNKHT